MEEKTLKVSSGTIARTIILIFALINQILSITGHSIIPIEDSDIELMVSTIFTVVTSIVAWWKNNSFTQKAIAADKTFK